MPAPTSNAPELLRQEILAEAQRQKEAILSRAQQAAAAILAKAEREAQQCLGERMEAAEAEAKRRTEAILATVPVEAGRARSARVEALLQAIHDHAREQLRARNGFDFRKTIARLSGEALQQMAGDAFRLRLSAADCRAVGDGLAEEIQRCSTRRFEKLPMVSDPTLKDGDLLLEDSAGRQVWNLSLEARLERCWPDLRRQIAARTAILEPRTT